MFERVAGCGKHLPVKADDAERIPQMRIFRIVRKSLFAIIERGGKIAESEAHE